MPFIEIVFFILFSVFVGWLLAMASTWLILVRVLPWLDRRMLPPVPTKQETKAPTPALSNSFQQNTLLNRSTNPALDVIVQKGGS